MSLKCNCSVNAIYVVNVIIKYGLLFEFCPTLHRIIAISFNNHNNMVFATGASSAPPILPWKRKKGAPLDTMFQRQPVWFLGIKDPIGYHHVISLINFIITLNDSWKRGGVVLSSPTRECSPWINTQSWPQFKACSSCASCYKCIYTT